MQPKSKLIAGILGVSLGAFGIHNFYLGKNNTAIIQIVVTILTCGIGGLWGMIEGILIFANYPSVCVDGNNQPLYDSPRYQVVAGLLGVFLGGFGVHNFYVGKKDIALIQLIVSIVSGGAGALWGVVEGILILFGYGSYVYDAEGKPLIKM